MASRRAAAQVADQVKRKTFLRRTIPAGKATPAPPLGPELGQEMLNPVETNRGILKIYRELGKLNNRTLCFVWIPGNTGIKGNDKVDRLAKFAFLESMQVQIAAFCKDFNEKTGHIKPGIPIPTEISVNPDRSFNIKLLNPPISYFLLQAAGSQKGAMKPGQEFCGIITLKHVYEIAKIKSEDPAFAFHTLENVCKTIIGQAHGMGIQVVPGPLDLEEYKNFKERRALEVAEQEKELEEIRLAKMLRL